MNNQSIDDQNMLRVVERAYARAHEALRKFHACKSLNLIPRELLKALPKTSLRDWTSLRGWNGRRGCAGQVVGRVESGQGKKVTEGERRPLFTSDSNCVGGVNKGCKERLTGL